MVGRVRRLGALAKANLLGMVRRRRGRERGTGKGRRHRIRIRTNLGINKHNSNNTTHKRRRLLCTRSIRSMHLLRLSSKNLGIREEGRGRVTWRVTLARRTGGTMMKMKSEEDNDEKDEHYEYDKHNERYDDDQQQQQETSGKTKMTIRRGCTRTRLVSGIVLILRRRNSWGDGG